MEESEVYARLLVEANKSRSLLGLPPLPFVEPCRPIIEAVSGFVFAEGPHEGEPAPDSVVARPRGREFI